MNYIDIEIPEKYSLMIDGVEFVLDIKYEFIKIRKYTILILSSW